jgi:hypothetical protein
MIVVYWGKKQTNKAKSFIAKDWLNMYTTILVITSYNK